MDARLALDLHMLKTHEPDKAEALLTHFRRQLEAVQINLERCDDDKEVHRLQGEARLLRENLNMFEDARAVVEASKRKNNGRTGYGPVLA